MASLLVALLALTWPLLLLLVAANTVDMKRVFLEASLAAAWLFAVHLGAVALVCGAAFLLLGVVTCDALDLVLFTMRLVVKGDRRLFLLELV